MGAAKMKKQPKFSGDSLNIGLARLMTRTGTNSETLAKALGATPSAVRQWRTGHSRPSLDKLPKIARYFGVTLDCLMSGCEEECGEPEAALALKAELYAQLAERELDTEILRAQVDTLVWLWGKEREMQNDIDANGRLIMSISSQGKEYERDNPAVKDLIMYSKQTLAIIKELGLTTPNIKPEEESEL